MSNELIFKSYPRGGDAGWAHDNEVASTRAGERSKKKGKKKKVKRTDGRLVFNVEQGTDRTAAGTRVVTTGDGHKLFKPSKKKSKKQGKKDAKKAEKQLAKSMQRHHLAVVTEKAARDSVMVGLVTERRNLQNRNVQLRRSIATTVDWEMRKGAQDEVRENEERIEEITKMLWSDVGKSVDPNRQVSELAGLLLQKKQLEAKLEHVSGQWNRTSDMDLRRGYSDTKRDLTQQLQGVAAQIGMVKARMETA